MPTTDYIWEVTTPDSNLHKLKDAEAMRFKGTLGTGGTITTLPSASASNRGDSYKVITDGTYASQEAHVGDWFTSDGSVWQLFTGSGGSGTTYTFEDGVNSFTVTPDGGTAQTVNVTPSIANATTSTSGLMSATDKTKLNGIATGAEVNQNAFSNIKVGNTTIQADSKTDTLELVAGSNVTITPDDTNDKVTISATDTNTTYSLTQDSSDGHKITLTPSSGTAQTLTIPDNNTTYTLATGDNNGQIKVTPSSGNAYNVSVKGLGSAAYKNATDSYSATGADVVTGKAVAAALDTLPEPMVFKGSLGTGGTITTLPVDGSASVGDTYKVITAGTYASQTAKVGDTFICDSKTSLLNTWVLIPSGDEPSGTVTSVAVSNGGGLSVSGSPITSSGTITISHSDTSSQASVSNTGRTYIQSVTLDTYGHVTGLSSATETVTNTDTKVTQTATTTNADYELLFSGTADNTTRTEGVGKNSNLKANPSTGKITSNIVKVNKYVSKYITGTGTVGSADGSTHYPSKWVFNIGLVPVDGDEVTFMVPVAGYSKGTWMSTDNETTYHPIALQSGTRLNTEFPVGAIVTVVYCSTIACATYAIDGSTGSSSVTGVWLIKNNYNTNTDTNVKQTPTTTDANYEVIFSKSNNNTDETSYVRKNNNFIFNPNSGTVYASYYGSDPTINSRLTSLDFTGVQAGAGKTKMRLDLVSVTATTGAPPADTGKNSSGYLHTYAWDSSTSAMTQLYIPNGDHITSTNGPQGLMMRGLDNGVWKDWVKIPFFTTGITSGQVLVSDGTMAGIKSSGYTIAKSVPSNADFTNTHRPIQVNGTEILGNNTTALNLKAGSNVSVTNSSGTVTIAATDTNTTYTFANGTNGFTVTPSGGSAQTVTVTPSIANNVTGSGTSGYIAKFNGANTITNGPQLGSSTTTYLRNDGSWATPTDTNTHRPIQMNGTEILGNNTTALNLKAGSNVTLSNDGGTVTINSSYSNTDVNVTQTATSTNANYEVLFSATADNTTRTETARKNSNLLFNPSTGILYGMTEIRSRDLSVSASNGTSGGISLYSNNGNMDNYGIYFRQTSNKEKHGYVQGDWATYFTMNDQDNRGWVFRRNKTTGNVASIDTKGNVVANGSVTVGGNATNTSGVRMVYDSTNECMNLEFAS